MNDQDIETLLRLQRHAAAQDAIAANPAVSFSAILDRDNARYAYRRALHDAAESLLHEVARLRDAAQPKGNKTVKLNDRSYWRTMPTTTLLDAAKYSDNELAIVLAERLADAQADIAKLWRQYDAMQAAHDDA